MPVTPIINNYPCMIIVEKDKLRAVGKLMEFRLMYATNHPRYDMCMMMMHMMMPCPVLAGVEWEL